MLLGKHNMFPSVQPRLRLVPRRSTVPRLSALLLNTLKVILFLALSLKGTDVTQI